jgi:hypothetical protein
VTSTLGDCPLPHLLDPRLLGLTDDARDQCLKVRIADVLLDLDAEHLGWAHALVQELDHAAELARDPIGHEDEADAAGSEDPIGHEDEADAAGSEVLLDVIPETLWIELIAEASPEDVLGLLAVLGAAALEV